jgi:hypothetical protein
MSILSDIYHISEASSADVGFSVLLEPVSKQFVLDLDSFSELDDKKSTTFWNFGDPFCNPEDNELVGSTVLHSIADHIYTYAGTYKVNNITNINGTLFHIEKEFYIAGITPIVVAIPSSGSYNSPQNITLTADRNSTIYYTTNGSTPTTASTIYTDPIIVTSSITLKYFAVDNFGAASEITTLVYIFDNILPATNAIPDGGIFNAPFTITLTANESVTVYYTLDGTNPTTSSTVYVEPISITQDTILKYFSIDSANNISDTITEEYVFDYVPPVVNVSTAGGMYNQAQYIELISDKPAIIYYTTNGSTPNSDSTQYTTPIFINTDTTLKYFAVDEATNVSSVVTVNYTFDFVIPTITNNVSSGTYNTEQNVSLSASEPSTIYYTIDGNEPTSASTVYTTPIVVNTDTTLKYFAIDAVGNSSVVYTVPYTFDYDAPIVTPSSSSGLYNVALNVALSANEAATIYYTINGTEPTTASNVYSTPIFINSDTTLKYFAIDAGTNSSTVQTMNYTFDFAAPTIVPSIYGGTYNNAQSISLSASEPSTIYYTIDGSEPTTNSPIYFTPINIDADTTLKYFAIDSIGNISNVVTQSYVIHITTVAARYWRILQTGDSYQTLNANAFYTVNMYSSSTASGTDVALNKTAVASTEFFTNVANNAFDGNDSTMWLTSITPPDKQWISVDLVTPTIVDSMSILFYQSGGDSVWADAYAIQYSNDNSNWNTLNYIYPNIGQPLQTFNNLSSVINAPPVVLAYDTFSSGPVYINNRPLEVGGTWTLVQNTGGSESGISSGEYRFPAASLLYASNTDVGESDVSMSAKLKFKNSGDTIGFMAKWDGNSRATGTYIDVSVTYGGNIVVTSYVNGSPTVLATVSAGLTATMYMELSFNGTTGTLNFSNSSIQPITFTVPDNNFSRYGFFGQSAILGNPCVIDNYKIVKLYDAPILTVSSSGGTYSSTQNVAISGNVPVDIYYTIDGNEPTTASQIYISSIPISATTTLKYFGINSNGSSNVETQLYTIIPAQITMNVLTGEGGGELWVDNVYYPIGTYSIDQGTHTFEHRGTHPSPYTYSWLVLTKVSDSSLITEQFVPYPDYVVYNQDVSEDFNATVNWAD